MTYRFLKFTSSYPSFTSQFLRDNPDYFQYSYEQFQNKCINNFFYIPHSKYLSELGNEIKTFDISIKPLQELWAKEHSINYSNKNWKKEIAFAQIKSYDPDVIYLDDLYTFDQAFRNEIRAQINREIKIIGWRSAPTSDFSSFCDIDLMTSAHPGFIEAFKQHNIPSLYLPLAFEPSVLNKIHSQIRDIDFSFLGSIGNAKSLFNNRYNIISKLLHLTPLEIWGDYHQVPLTWQTSIAKLIPSIFLFTQKTNMNKNDPFILRNRIHESVFNEKYFWILSRSKLTFNYHIDCSDNYAGNMRLFEATGMGACLVTDWKDNIADFFEPGVEIITYHTLNECVDKVNYYLKHDDEREEVAYAGQKRTLRDHTYQKRMNILNDAIINLLN